MVLLVVGFAAAVGFHHWQNSGSGNALQEIGSELGLQYEEVSQRRQLRGRIDDIGVSVKTTTENRGGDTHWFTDFEISAPDQPHVRMVGASLRQKAIGGLQGEEWLETGEPAFDDAVLIKGDPAEILGRLTEKTRPAIQSATDAGWELEALTWKARESGRMTNAAKIRSILEAGLAAARALQETQGAAVSAATNSDLPTNGPADTTANPSPDSASSTDDLEALAEVNTPRSLDAALRLAKAGDLRQEVRNRLILAVISKERLEEVIALLGEVGGPIDIALLSSIKGEHEEAAQAAIAAIESRQ